MAHDKTGARYADWLLTLALFALALPFAFRHLDFQSLWLDEGTTQAYVTNTYLSALLFDLVRPSQGYPLYHVLLKLVTRTLGDGEWALRAPSALAGALAVPALYALGAELRGRVIGLAAALMLAFAPWGLGLAQEAKVYSLALLVVVINALLFARAMRLGGRRRWLVWIAFALVLPFRSPSAAPAAAGVRGRLGAPSAACDTLARADRDDAGVCYRRRSHHRQHTLQQRRRPI